MRKVQFFVLYFLCLQLFISGRKCCSLVINNLYLTLVTSCIIGPFLCCHLAIGFCSWEILHFEPQMLVTLENFPDFVSLIWIMIVYETSCQQIKAYLIIIIIFYVSLIFPKLCKGLPVEIWFKKTIFLRIIFKASCAQE